VEAFTLLKETRPELKLVLAGKKEFYFESLENAIADHEYRNDIVITGYISDEELKWLYQNAACYVLPSLSEGFGLPGLEAMAHGCPLVSSNATCLPEIYGPAAEYFDPYSTKKMAVAIDKVLSSTKKQKELIALGEKQLQRYSWHKMTKQIHETLLQTAN